MDEIRKILDKYRETCHFYLKIDFGLLAGIVSVFTLLKLERIEVFRALFLGRIIFIGLFILICYGLMVNWETLLWWSAQELSDDKKKSILHRSKVNITIQHFLHILFIVITFGSISCGEGYQIGYDIVTIQAGIEKFKLEREVFPETLTELVSYYPSISENIWRLGKNKLKYKLDKTRGYVFQEAGYDGKLGTKDDIIEDHNSFTEKMNFDYPASNKELHDDVINSVP